MDHKPQNSNKKGPNRPNVNKLLLLAAKRGSVDTLKVHLLKGDDLNTRDGMGNTPLIVAAAYNHAAACRLLLEHGVDPDIENDGGYSALDVARLRSADDVISVIEKYYENLERSRAKPGEIQKKINKAFTDTAEKPTAEFLDWELVKWEPEEEQILPTKNISLVASINQTQLSITKKNIVDDSEDWSHIDVYLPKLAVTHGNERTSEIGEMLRPVFLRAIREGSVPEGFITATIGDENRIIEEKIRQTINDLGAEIDERQEYKTCFDDFTVEEGNLPSHEESLTIDDAVNSLNELISPTNDPYKIFLKQLKRKKLLTKSEEADIAQELEARKEEILKLLLTFHAGLAATIEVINLNKNSLNHDGDQGQHDVIILEDIIQNIDRLYKEIKYFSRELFEASAKQLELYKEIKKINIDSRTLQLILNKVSAIHEKYLDSKLSLEYFLKRNCKDASNFSLDGISIAGLSTLEFSLVNNTYYWKESQYINIVAFKSLVQHLKESYLNLTLPSDKFYDVYKQLHEKYNEFNKTKLRLVEPNIRLVIHIAKGFSSPAWDIMDAIQDGMFGLLKAIDRFDYRKGFKFSTYATWWIRQTVGRGKDDKLRFIRLPVYTVAQTKKIDAIKKDFIEKNIKGDFINYAIEILNESSINIRNAIDAIKIQPSSLSDLNDVDAKIDSIELFASVSPYESFAQSESANILHTIIKKLPKVEQQIIVLRYGIGLQSERTLNEIGSILGVTRERVRQIETKALTRLKLLYALKTSSQV
jgi:RNA polymerase primary sigma factor